MTLFVIQYFKNPHQVIAGWEEGFNGQCAGERITMIVPPSLGYGNQASDKVTMVTVKMKS